MMRRWWWRVTLVCLALVSCGEDGDGDGGNPGVGAPCDFGDDCRGGLYCAYSFVTERGQCHEAPEGCQQPLGCSECPAIYDPCQSPNFGCSVSLDAQGRPNGNVTVSCN